MYCFLDPTVPKIPLRRMGDEYTITLPSITATGNHFSSCWTCQTTTCNNTHSLQLDSNSIIRPPPPPLEDFKRPVPFSEPVPGVFPGTSLTSAVNQTDAPMQDP